MSRRHIFTERQRAALFDLPTDELSLLKFYTLGDDGVSLEIGNFCTLSTLFNQLGYVSD